MLIPFMVPKPKNYGVIFK